MILLPCNLSPPKDFLCPFRSQGYITNQFAYKICFGTQKEEGKDLCEIISFGLSRKAIGMAESLFQIYIFKRKENAFSVVKTHLMCFNISKIMFQIYIH